MPKVNLKGDTAKEYRKNNPDKPTLALARIMYKENKKLFKDVEDARSRLRYIEGKQGTMHRQKVKGSEFFKEGERPKNPYNLPESDEKPILPYVLKGHKRVLVLNDVHLPYHSIEAINSAFDYAKKEKPDGIVLNGDIIDCYKLSYFSKDPRERNFAYELKQFKDFFEVLQKVFKCKVYYKFGNHEVRYDQYLFEKAGELVGVEEFELANIIKARANGIEIINDKTRIKLNHLDLIHGHEFGRGFFNPVNAARGLHLRAKVSAMQGDCHKTSEHTETDLHGNIKTTWSVGALCGLQPKFCPYNGWNHGLAIVDLDLNKVDFEVRNKRIHKGKVI